MNIFVEVSELLSLISMGNKILWKVKFKGMFNSSVCNILNVMEYTNVFYCPPRFPRTYTFSSSYQKYLSTFSVIHMKKIILRLWGGNVTVWIDHCVRIHDVFIIVFCGYDLHYYFEYYIFVFFLKHFKLRSIVCKMKLIHLYSLRIISFQHGLGKFIRHSLTCCPVHILSSLIYSLRLGIFARYYMYYDI